MCVRERSKRGKTGRLGNYGAGEGVIREGYSEEGKSDPPPPKSV